MARRRPRNKVGFFARLTGAYEDEDIITNKKDETDVYDDDEYEEEAQHQHTTPSANHYGERELAIDLINTPDDLVLIAHVPGVDPNKVDISLSRELVTLSTEEGKTRIKQNCDYFYQELYQGSYSRTVVLPQEIVVEKSKADIKEGILTIILPKIDRDKKTRLKVDKK